MRHLEAKQSGNADTMFSFKWSFADPQWPNQSTFLQGSIEVAVRTRFHTARHWKGSFVRPDSKALCRQSMPQDCHKKASLSGTI